MAVARVYWMWPLFYLITGSAAAKNMKNGTKLPLTDTAAATPRMGACGREGLLVVYRAGHGRVIVRSWGEHTGWAPSEVTLINKVDLTPDTPIYAACRNGEANGAIWVKDGIINTLYEEAAGWGTYKQQAGAAPASMVGDPPLGVSARAGFQGIWWAGSGKIHFMESGAHTGWASQVMTLPPDVPITPGTPVYAFSRQGEADGVIWASDGFLHIVYHDSNDWARWIYSPVPAAVTGKTPLAVCGRVGFFGIFWATDRRINLMHSGAHNNWFPAYTEIDQDVDIKEGALLNAQCIEGAYDGVIWNKGAKFHHVYESVPDWGSWKYEIFAENTDA